MLPDRYWQANVGNGRIAAFPHLLKQSLHSGCRVLDLVFGQTGKAALQVVAGLGRQFDARHFGLTAEFSGLGVRGILVAGACFEIRAHGFPGWRFSGGDDSAITAVGLLVEGRTTLLKRRFFAMVCRMKLGGEVPARSAATAIRASRSPGNRIVVVGMAPPRF